MHEYSVDVNFLYGTSDKPFGFYLDVYEPNLGGHPKVGWSVKILAGDGVDDLDTAVAARNVFIDDVELNFLVDDKGVSVNAILPLKSTTRRRLGREIADLLGDPALEGTIESRVEYLSLEISDRIHEALEAMGLDDRNLIERLYQGAVSGKIRSGDRIALERYAKRSLPCP